MHQTLLLKLLMVQVALAFPGKIWAVPNVCDVVRSSHFRDALDFKYRVTTCGKWPFPRPCAHFEYYVPKYFVEIVGNPKETYFSTLPGVAVQLAWTKGGLPFGTDDDNGAYSFHAHVIRVPLANAFFLGLPCSGALPDLFCFSAMSEHLGSHWQTGLADRFQPKFLAWSASPKACLVKGALASTGGSWEGGIGQDVSTCSAPLDWLPLFPPSNQPVCTGWGIHFPRTGTVTSSDPTTASLVIASRIKSIGSEVLQSISSSFDEKWQMIYPQTSSTFKEGQNIALLMTKGVNELGRLSGHFKNYLYVVWQKTECTGEIPQIWEAKAWISGMSATCKALP
jgi:hypothetical protein